MTVIENYNKYSYDNNNIDYDDMTMMKMIM